jgi:predicted DCC family thiol-disulfide oxidoreductase YuxK
MHISAVNVHPNKALAVVDLVGRQGTSWAGSDAVLAIATKILIKWLICCHF